MKNTTLTATVISLFLLAGCAGITDANFTEVEGAELTSENALPTNLTPSEDREDENATIIFGGEREDIIIVRPTEDDDRD